MLQKPIGIMGGTFDPVHFGHLRAAIELQQVLHLAEVHLIPCYMPVHRTKPIVSAEHRINMLTLATRNESHLVVNDCEIIRQGPSYSVDTLLSLRQQYIASPLCLILGLDAFLNFTSWHRWQEIINLAHIIVIPRANYTLPTSGNLALLLQKRQGHDYQDLHKTLAGKIFFQPVTHLAISATFIREQIALKNNIRYLLPDAVYEYILQHSTYPQTPL